MTRVLNFFYLKYFAKLLFICVNGNNKKIVIDDAIKGYLNNIYYREILGMKAGIIFINYEFRIMNYETEYRQQILLRLRS